MLESDDTLLVYCVDSTLKCTLRSNFDARRFLSPRVEAEADATCQKSERLIPVNEA